MSKPMVPELCRYQWEILIKALNGTLNDPEPEKWHWQRAVLKFPVSTTPPPLAYHPPYSVQVRLIMKEGGVQGYNVQYDYKDTLWRFSESKNIVGQSVIKNTLHWEISAAHTVFFGKHLPPSLPDSFLFTQETIGRDLQGKEHTVRYNYADATFKNDKGEIVDIREWRMKGVCPEP